MNPEDRLYMALDGKQADRIPTLSLSIDPNVANQVLGLRPLPVLQFLDSDFGSRFVDRNAAVLSKFSDLALLLLCHQGARVNYNLGFDGLMIWHWQGKIRNHRQIEDVFGRLFDITDDGYGNPYLMYNKGLIETPDEWRSWPRPPIWKFVSRASRVYRLLRWTWHKKIALVPFVATGLWELGWQPMGFTRFVTLMRKDPGFVRELVGYLTSLSVACIDAYCRAGARVVGIGDDLAYKAGPMLSPEMLEDFYGDGYRQIAATAHRYGSKIIFHCCGNTNDLVEKFVEWGFDGAHAFEPTAMNNLAEARKKVKDRLCLIGNIDVTHTLVDGTREEVQEEVKKAIRDSTGGGFILAPTHTHASMNPQNLKWMIEAANGNDRQSSST